MTQITDPLRVYELALKVALQTPISDLSSLCIQNSTLRDICNSEEFWKIRLTNDLPGKWKLKNKTYKESYQFWYLAKVKARPFGYYPDDQQVLDSLPRYRYDNNDRHMGTLHEVKLDISVSNVDQIINDIITYQEPKDIPLLDFICYHKIDQIQFLTKFFKTTGFDRLNLTLPESIDLLCYVTDRGFFDQYLTNKPRILERASILSSLNEARLREFLGSTYRGELDYPSLLFSAVEGQSMTEMMVLINPAVYGFRFKVFDPLDFNNNNYRERYEYIKRFDLIKIIWLSRSYMGHLMGIKSYPPYLYVSISPPNVILEETYRKVNENNYISTLNQLNIRTDDNPSYSQSLARITMINDLGWTVNYNNNFLEMALGLPKHVIDSLSLLRRTFSYSVGNFMRIISDYLEV